MKRQSLAILFFLCAFALSAQEGSNPFTSHGPAPRAALVAPGSGLSAWALQLLAPIQRELNDSLAAVTQSLKGSRTLAGLLLVLGLSLAYGVFHAAGPGHGKTVVSSYFVANEPKVTHVLMVGNLIALVHALSALTVVLVLSFLVRGFLSSGVDQANGYIQKVSFAIIAVIGLYLLVQRIRGHAHHHGNLQARAVQGGHRHAEGQVHGHGQPPDPAAVRGLRSLLVIALPAGMIPCPGAIAVIVFALSLHMFWVSVISVAAMSLGMGITISVAALLVVLAKRGALHLFAGGGGDQQTTARRVVEIAGAAALFLFGGLLFIAQF